MRYHYYRADSGRYQEETQFYPTPAFVAERVAELADIPSDCTILEPSAGTGSLLDAVHVPCNFTVIEPLTENAAILKKKGYETVIVKIAKTNR